MKTHTTGGATFLSPSIARFVHTLISVVGRPEYRPSLNKLNTQRK